jgi:hypothetical protein
MMGVRTALKRVGSYQTADGKWVRTEDLSPEKQAKVKQYGALRNLNEQAGDAKGVAEWQAKVNEQYKPESNPAQDIADEIGRRLALRDKKKR